MTTRLLVLAVGPGVGLSARPARAQAGASPLRFACGFVGDAGGIPASL